MAPSNAAIPVTGSDAAALPDQTPSTASDNSAAPGDSAVEKTAGETDEKRLAEAELSPRKDPGKQTRAVKDTGKLKASGTKFTLTASPIQNREAPAGSTARVNISLSANNTPGGALIIVPVYKDYGPGKHTNISDTGNAYIEAKDNYTFSYDGAQVTVDKALLIWKTAPGGSFATDYDIDYHFDNGITPDGTTFDVKAYVFEASGVTAGKPGTILTDGANNDSATVTLTAQANEAWSVDKTIISPSSAADQEFTALKERPYADIPDSSSAADDWAITYQLSVQTNKSVADYGRMFMDKITVTDTLSGYLASGTPTSIVVREGSVTGPVVQHTVSANTGTAQTISFDILPPGPDKYITSKNYYVTVIFNKDNYTNLRNMPQIISGVQTVNNSATVTDDPSDTYFPGIANRTSPASAKDVKFGWYQGEPTLPVITIQKKLKLSNLEREYHAGLAKTYENNPSLAEGSLSAVTFSLQKVASETDSTPQGAPVTQQLVLGNGIATLSLAKFTDIEAGTYRLKETVGIAGIDKPAALDNDGALVVVTDDNGIFKMTIDGVDYTSPSKRYNAVNASEKVGYVKIYVKRQQLYQDPPTYESYQDAELGIYAQQSDTTPLATQTVAGADPGGSYVLFENLPVGTTYYIKQTAKAATDRLVLFGVNAGQPATPGNTDRTVQASNGSVSTYTAFFNNNYGGFRTAKVFYDPDGTQANTGAFTVYYKLYKDAALTIPYSTASTYDFTVNNTEISNTSGFIQQAFEAGTYWLKEVGLTIPSLDSSSDIAQNKAVDKYGLYPAAGQSSAISLTIVAGTYAASPTSISTDLVEQTQIQGAAGMTAGRLVNKSKFGRLSIRNFNADGTPVGSTFTVTGPPSYNNGTGTKNITIPANGVYDEFVPAGDYVVKEAAIPKEAILSAIESDYHTAGEVKIKVGQGTNSNVNVTVSGGNITWGNSAQLGVFVWKYLPYVQGEKVRRDNPTGTDTAVTSVAKFTVYKLDGADYKQTASPAVTASVGAGGIFKTNVALPAGTYAFIETTLPNATNFIEPPYWADAAIRSGGVFQSSIPKATVETAAYAIPRTTITTAQYRNAPTPATAIDLPATVLNVPKNNLTLHKTNAKTSAAIPGAVFGVYTDLACTTPAKDASGADIGGTTDGSGNLSLKGLTPGTYYLTEKSPDPKFVGSNAKLKVTINQNGWPVFDGSNWDNQVSGGTTASADITPVESGGVNAIVSAINVTNLEKPSIKFQKLGELDEWDVDLNRTTAPLPGAGFTLKGASGKYYTVDANKNAVLNNGDGSAPAAGTASISSGTGGYFDIKYLDPADAPYYMEETVVPAVPGADPDAGQKYVPLKFYLFISPNANGTAYEFSMSARPNPGPGETRPVGDEVIIENEIEAHHIRIYKLPVTFANDTDATAGYKLNTVDDDVSTWQDVRTINCIFYVYLYDAAAPNHRGKLVDRIYIGTDLMAASSSGTSKGLPPGRYVVREVQAPMFYGTPGQSLPENEKFEQNGAFHVWRDRPSAIDLTNGQIPDESNKDATFEVVIPPSSPADTTETIEITAGNSNYAKGGGINGEDRLARLYGIKNGYEFKTETSTYQLVSSLGNISFKVYPAWRDEQGTYHAFPMKNGEPLALVTSNDFNTAQLREGEFLTDYFNVASAFYYGGADWAEPATLVKYRQYAINRNDDEYGDPHPLITGLGDYRMSYNTRDAELIDWDKVPDEIRYQYANSYKAWDLVLIEQEAPGGGSPFEGGSDYHFDPADPPKFGITIEDSKETMHTYSQDTDPSGKPTPFELRNYKGGGYIKLTKHDVKGGQLADATFELWMCDKDHINFATTAGKEAALANASYIKTITTSATGPTDEEIEKAGILPGYYLLREITPPPQYNDYGSWATFTNNAAAGDKSGDFTSYEAGGDAVIGPVIVYPANNNIGIKTRIEVRDKLRPTIKLANAWAGQTVTDDKYSGEYMVTFDGTGWKGPKPVAGGDGVIPAKDSSDGSGDLPFLKDGNYTVHLNNISAAANSFFVKSVPMSSADLTFTVANSAIVPASIKVGTTAVGTDPLSDVWYTDDGNDFVIHINHLARGQLTILKGGIDGSGMTSEDTTGLSTATFSYEQVEGGTNMGIITWTQGDNASGGKRTILNPGIYKITETSAVGTGWVRDASPAYVKVEDGKVVYLQNQSKAASTQEKPLQNNSGAYFYNISAEGTFEIKKLAGSSDTVNLRNAEFELYRDANEDGIPDTPGSPQETITYNAMTDNYQFTVAAGHYVIKETVAPVGYGLRNDYVKITVQSGEAPKYVGFDDPANINAIGFLDPPLFDLTLIKETTYSAIGTAGQPDYIAERTVRIGSLPIYLWMRTDPATTGNTSEKFTAVAPGAGGYAATITREYAEAQGLPDSAIGTATIKVSAAGEYRVTERVTEGHAYLLTNTAYKMQDTSGAVVDIPDTSPTLPDGTLLGTAPSLNIVYNPATNRLEVDNSNGNPNWNTPNANALTINNTFIGYVFTAQKVDYLTGKMVESVPGTKFALYDTEEHAKAGATGPGSGLLEEAVDTDGNGYVCFAPGWLTAEDIKTKLDANGHYTRWVREVAPPTGYLIDDWYDAQVKEVFVNPSDSSLDQTLAKFSDGKVTPRTFGLTKTVKGGKPGETAVTTPLSESGFSTTYVLEQAALNNSLPIYNYTIEDGTAGLSGFTYKGRNAAGVEVDVPAPLPTHKITSVRIGPSISYHDAELSQADTDPVTGVPSGAQRQPVWARINGGVWTQLSATANTTFTMPADTTYLNVEYSDTDPGTAGKAYVGTMFDPGDIEIDVTFDTFSTTKAQPEVDKIINTATVSGDDGDGAKYANDVTAKSTIEMKVNERPIMTINKECTDDKILDPNLNINDRRFFGGDTVQYTVTLKNESTEDLAIEHPMILDYMEPDALTMALDSATGQPIYEVKTGSTAAGHYLDGTAYNGTVHFKVLEGNVVLWEFPDMKLAKGETVSVTFKLQISLMFSTATPRNEAYGTSGKLPLVPSLSHLAGASFTASNMADPDAVYADNPDTRAKESWSRLESITEFDPSVYGLFVRDDDALLTINSSGEVSIEKAVKVNNGAFTALNAPIDIDLNDTVTFRLGINNSFEIGGGKNLTNIRIADILPYPSDTRNSTWNSLVRDHWKFVPGSLTVVSRRQGPLPAAQWNAYSANTDPQTPPDWMGGATGSAPTEDMTSFVINMGNDQMKDAVPTGFQLEPEDRLYIEFTMEFDAAAKTTERDGILSANNLSIAANDFRISYQPVSGGIISSDTPTNLTSNHSTVRIVSKPVSITGVAWEDTNYNGVLDNNEAPLANVPVELWRIDPRGSAGNEKNVPVLVSDVIGITNPQTTDENGEYAFHGLESSYNTGLLYQVRFGLPTTTGTEYTRTAMDAVTQDAADGLDAASARDSDAHPQDASDGSYTYEPGHTKWYPVKENRDKIDAGYYRLSKISGRAFFDKNGDGIQDPVDDVNGVSNMIVSLYASQADAEAGGTPLARITTGPDGLYEFVGVKAKSDNDGYRLRFDKTNVTDAAHTFEWVPEHQGSDPEKDSDAIPYSPTPPALRSDPIAIASSGTVAYNDTTGHIDAGLKQVSKAIEGYVWEDKNYDGLQNGPAAPDPLNENPLAGITVKLYQSADNGATYDASPIATTTTGADGRYRFTGTDAAPAAGIDFGPDKAYKVVIDKKDSAYSYTLKNQGGGTGDSQADQTGADAGAIYPITAPVTNADCGQYMLGNISGEVWFDAAGEGNKADKTPAAPAGATVKLYKEEPAGTWTQVGAVVTTTAAKADYSFTELKAGTYKVVFDKSGVTSASETYFWTKPDIAAYAPANDSNASHKGDAADGLGTDAALDLAYKAAHTAGIVLGYGESGSDYDAGIRYDFNEIKGVVWEDVNYDGERAFDGTKTTEPLLSGVTVELYKDNTKMTETWATTTTDANGEYHFRGTDGKGIDFSGGAEYMVVFTNPDTSNFSWTKGKAAGVSDEFNSDAGSFAGTTAAFDKTAASHEMTAANVNTPLTENVDAGLWKVSKIRGKMWRDINDDGLMQDALTEPGVAGSTVTLTGTDVNGAVTMSVTTKADGTYEFTGLKKGAYSLSVDKPVVAGEDARWAITKAGAGANPLIDSDAEYADRLDKSASVKGLGPGYGETLTTLSDIGVVPYVHISGIAWLDKDRDGIYSDGEDKFPDIKVELFRSGSDTPVATQITDAQGEYTFDGLLLVQGQTNYKVVFYNPDAETYSYTAEPKTAAAIMHTATDLKGSALGPAGQNYHDEAHTAYVDVLTHNEHHLNSGYYVIPSYKVTYVPNGGTASWGSGTHTITVKEGRLVPSQNVSRTDYTFNGWFLGPNNTYKWAFGKDLMPARDITLTAMWTKVPTPPTPPNPLKPHPPKPSVGPAKHPAGSTASGKYGIGTPLLIPSSYWPNPPELPASPEQQPLSELPPTDSLPDGTGAQTPGAADSVDCWSLLSLLMSLIAVIITLLLLIFMIVRRRRDNDDDDDENRYDDDDERRRRQRMTIFTILAAIFGILTPIVWLLLDNLDLPMDWINRYTLYVAIIFVIHLIFCIIHKMRRGRNEDDNEEQNSGTILE
ncbi:MAG: InlB B-repeat-containing protein [Clostridiales Family XIII bacterium]|jgi:uncharacterized repeat protein (TIGR02543 family)|nr:InlB B-repeat-containing protein [Clostridiales Family XIII bacterium]